MRRLTVTALVVCATAVSAAAEGVYVSESLGGTSIGDELAAHMDSAFRIRFAAGIRHRQWAVEGFFAGGLGTGSSGSGSSVTAYPPSKCSYGCDVPQQPTSSLGTVSGLVTYGIDVKYLNRLSPNVEVYLRGSMSRGHLDGGDYAGNGLGLGAGAQLKGKVPALGFLFWPFFFTNLGPKVTAAVFVDSGFEFYRFHPDGGRDAGGGSIDAQLSHLTVGWAVGTDF